jgi:Asp-tRNA(Asn)/Glu-tRNA(Gln) amidotransferase C subunit
MLQETLDDARIICLSRWSGLELSAERRGTLAPALNDISQTLETLNVVNAGENPPALTFEPRWGIIHE